MTADYRDLCAELLATLELTWEIKPRVIQDLLNRARAALAAEPVGEGPSDEELLAEAAESLGYERIPLDLKGGAVEAYPSELIAFARTVLSRWGHPATPPAPEPVAPTDEELWAVGNDDFRGNCYPTDAIYFARAVLARWGTPVTPPAPEPGEVAELVAELELMANHAATACQFGDAKILSDAATLLQQQAAPAPGVGPVGECPHCGYEGEMARLPQAGEGEA